MRKHLRIFFTFSGQRVCPAILLLAMIAFSGSVKSQHHDTKGLPFITNYRYQDYNADGVNWWTAEDDKGVLYFANSVGILVFDGQHWELIKPPGRTETRSLVKGDDGKIYVGTSGDVGYMAPGKKGKLEFVSLKNQLPEKDRVFDEVWETQLFDKRIFFRTTNKLFIWDGKSFKVIESKEGFHVGGSVNGQYYCRIWERGLCVMKNDSFYVVPNGEKFANERTYAMLPYDAKTMLIGTRTQGLFLYDGKDFTPFPTEADPYIKNTSLYGGLVLSNGLIAINTFNDGMVIIDKQGKLIQRIDKSVGLQDNSVDEVFEDSHGNLWMPLFNGIAKFDLRSALTYYNESFGLPAKTVFTIGSNKGNIYCGTNNGVYMLDQSANHFIKIPGTSGQVGNFVKHGNDFLVAGAEAGLLNLQGAKATPVVPAVNYEFHVAGIVKSRLDTNVIYCGLRSGLAIVRYNPATAKYAVESFAEGLRTGPGFFNEAKDGRIWILGDNIGEIKLVKPEKKDGKLIITPASYDVYNYKQGLPRKTIYITELDKQLYFASEKDSVFVFDDKQNRFIRDTSSFIRHYIKEDADGTAENPVDAWGRTWANLGSGVIVKMPTTDGSVKIINAPFKELGRNYPVWNITPTIGKDGKPVVWLSGREGIIRYDGDLSETSGTSFKTIIRGIKLNDDSVYFAGFDLQPAKTDFSHRWNTFSFQYAAPFFKNETETVFSTYLEGRDKTWSEWSKQSFHEYGNLSAGKYTFHVKAKNIYDVESPETSFSFVILPPWYNTWWAYLLYAIGAFSIIYLVVRNRTKHLQDKHRELEKVVAERTVQLSQRAEELAVINSVQEGLVRELDMQAIYDLVGDKIRNVFNAQAVIIANFDHETNTEHFKYMIEKGERFYPEPRPMDKLRRYLVEKKQKVVINTNAQQRFAEFDNEILPGTEDPKSAVYVPLTIGDKISSYISLQNFDKENAFSDSDLHLLDTLANSMSVALENARLFDETKMLLAETEQGKKNVELLSEIGKEITASLDFETIFHKLYENINQLTDATIFGVGIYNADKQQLEYKYAVEKGKRYKPYVRDTKDKDQFPVWCIENRKPVFINNIKEEYGRYISKYGDKEKDLMLEDGSLAEEPLSLIYLPLIVQEQVLGIITIQSFQKNAYTNYHLNLLQNLATYTGIAIDNANAYRKLNEREQEIGQRAAELSAVNSISQALVSQLNTDELIKLVGDSMKDLFKANIVYLSMFDPKTRVISFPYQYGEVMPSRKIGDGLTSKIILTGKPLLINNDMEEKTEQLGVRPVGITAASYIGVPIPIGDEIIGVLSVQSTEQENRFNENDLRVLSTIAASVGVALRKAKLFEEVQAAKMDAEAARKAAEKANAAKSAFLSTVSHELRTPLTSVLGFAKIIRKRLEERIFPLTDKSDPKTEKATQQVSENLGVVISEGERLTTLINDVLDLAKIEAGRMEWNMDKVSLNEIVERATMVTTSLFDQKGLKLEKEMEPDLPEISGDHDKLIQVVVNLLSNAVKFTNEGKVKCKVFKENDEIIVSITDTGIGIAKEDYGAVFEQFKQVGGDTLTDKPKGTGLGLPICKEIIEHHGGRIWLESERGKGSTFSFALPAIKAHAVKPIQFNDLVRQLKEQVAQSNLNIKGRKATILVVDDDDSIRSLLQQELSDAGYIIEEATNGKEAVAKVRAQKPDLVILDVMMPEMNGFDVAAVLKNDPQTMDVPIIVLSIVQDKTRGYRIGVDRYLTKPIDTNLLFTEIGDLLEQGKSKKKVMVVDENSGTVNTLTDVLKAKGYFVVESDGRELVEKAVATQPDIIMINSLLSGKQEIVQTLRFEKGLENVLFLVYQ
jgi:signal transduction histidine kinase/CheY-like chemotaxis protein